MILADHDDQADGVPKDPLKLRERRHEADAAVLAAVEPGRRALAERVVAFDRLPLITLAFLVAATRAAQSVKGRLTG